MEHFIQLWGPLERRREVEVGGGEVSFPRITPKNIPWNKYPCLPVPLQWPYIWLLRLKFELANQDLAGRKTVVSWRQCLLTGNRKGIESLETFLVGDNVEYLPKYGI